MRRLGAIFALVAIALLGPLPCRAQADAANHDDARAEFDLGRAQFRLGRYAEATKAFRASYALSHQPLLLFNIAQAERRAGDLAAARDDYRRYLEARPDAPDRDLVTRYIEEVEQELASRPPKAPSPPPAPAPGATTMAPTATTVKTASPPPHQNALARRRRIAIGVGVGVAVLAAAGIVLAVTLTQAPSAPHAPLGEYRPFQ